MHASNFPNRTNDSTRHPRDCLGYLTSFCLGIFCALPCLWPPACFCYHYVRKRNQERRYLSNCLFLRLVCSSFFVTLSQLSRLVVILAKHKGDWSRTLSNTCWDEYLKQESLNWAENNLIWTNDFTTNYPRDCPGYLKAFGFGLFCALPCLWPPACFFWERIQKKIKERRERNLEAFERRRR